MTPSTSRPYPRPRPTEGRARDRPAQALQWISQAMQLMQRLALVVMAHRFRRTPRVRGPGPPARSACTVSGISVIFQDNFCVINEKSLHLGKQLGEKTDYFGTVSPFVQCQTIAHGAHHLLIHQKQQAPTARLRVRPNTAATPDTGTGWPLRLAHRIRDARKSRPGGGRPMREFFVVVRKVGG